MKNLYQFRILQSFVKNMQKSTKMFEVSCEPHHDLEENSCILIRKTTEKNMYAFAITKTENGFFVEKFIDGSLDSYDSYTTNEDVINAMLVFN